MKTVISENRTVNLQREMLGPVVPVERHAKDRGHDLKLFKLVEKGNGWIQSGLEFCEVNTPERERTKEIRVLLKERL